MPYSKELPYGEALLLFLGYQHPFRTLYILLTFTCFPSTD